jgi:hypothetical protein
MTDTEKRMERIRALEAEARGETVSPVAEKVVLKNLHLPLGLHSDVSEAHYHADMLCETPTLSRSLGQVLIDRAPIHAYHEHPRMGGKPKADGEDADDVTPAMDFGSLGHSLLLGRGQQVVVGEWKTWQSKDAKAFRETARANNRLPVLQKTFDRGVAMKAAAIEEFKRLGIHDEFFAATPEVVCLFKDGGVLCRVMFDRLLVANGRVKIFDVKITDSAKPSVCERQIQNMKYDYQEAFYRTAIERAIPELAGRIDFVFLFVESEKPHVVTPVELDGSFRMNGVSKYVYAHGVWEKCMRLNQWPAYANETYRASPKEWALAEEMGREMPKTFKE